MLIIQIIIILYTFSSAYTRLENFYYKVGLIQSSSNAIDNLPLNSGTL